MTANTYLLRVVIFGLLASCLVVGINYVVDPYGITGMQRVAGFNEHKVEINEHTQLLKKYQPLLSTHNALMVGNSRVELGIAPAHACFLDAGMDLYNLGMPGAAVETQLAYALNLLYQQPVETLFLSLDFTDFIASSAQPREDGSRLGEAMAGFRFTAAGTPSDGYYQSVFRDYLKSLFSLDALAASVMTIALQGESAADRDDAGFNPARDFAEAVRIEGPHALFAQKMDSLATKYSRPWYLRDAQGQLNPAFATLAHFLDIATARGIKVYLFTNPFHDSFWDLLRDQGHMTAYSDWMRSLQALVRNYPQGAVELWDFSADSPYIHEEVPAAGVRSGPLQWFWEPAHYRRELGDLMVNAMLSDGCGTDIAFGRRLH
ncbi:MAG: hypothetical protein KDI17_12630 [Halioglobus sp.]|nr:hypothetical protein [Halioglobus sp.]